MGRGAPRRRRRAAGGPGEAGEVFAGYTDLSQIASGAIATVYGATELDTGRRVAIKALKVPAAVPYVMEAFEREVKALAAVSSHPHIVTLYRTLTAADGRPALVLELCRESSADRLRHLGPRPSQEVVATAVKIAGALETAHRAGLLHRDLKPQNVLVTAYGEPALADFGVAALQAAAQANQGVFGFTTLHAAPEILEGGDLSPATDVYGLASTMYQLIAGRAPFAAYEGEALAAVILRVLRDPVSPLRSEGVPLSLSDLLQAALAKDPASRPASPAAFAQALRAVESECGWPATAYTVWGGDATPPAGSGATPAPLPVADGAGEGTDVGGGGAGGGSPLVPGEAPGVSAATAGADQPPAAAGEGERLAPASGSAPGPGSDHPYERTLDAAAFGTALSAGSLSGSGAAETAQVAGAKPPWVLVASAAAFAVAVAVLVCMALGVF